MIDANKARAVRIAELSARLNQSERWRAWVALGAAQGRKQAQNGVKREKAI